MSSSSSESPVGVGYYATAVQDDTPVSVGYSATMERAHSVPCCLYVSADGETMCSNPHSPAYYFATSKVRGIQEHYRYLCDGHVYMTNKNETSVKMMGGLNKSVGLLMKEFDEELRQSAITKQLTEVTAIETSIKEKLLKKETELKLNKMKEFKVGEKRPCPE